MVLRLIASSPRRSGFVCHRRPADDGFVRPVGLAKPPQRLDANHEASGPHAFAVRISVVRRRAVIAHRYKTRPAIPCAPDAAASTASRPNVRDDGQRPSWGRNGAGYAADLGQTKSGIFFARGLDDPNHVDRVEEIRFQAQVAFVPAS